MDGRLPPSRAGAGAFAGIEHGRRVRALDRERQGWRATMFMGAGAEVP